MVKRPPPGKPATEPPTTSATAADSSATSAAVAAPLDGETRERVAQVLAGEAALLAASLNAAWSASLVRTSIFLGVLSAAGVALGFVAQGGIDSPDFRAFALVVLPLVLFLGVATFVRLVQIQRESIVFITGLNRIRHFAHLRVPESRPYLVLPVHDDEPALYRSPGSGMNIRPPRFRMLYLAVQTQGIVGILTAVVAGAFGGLAVGFAGGPAVWIVAVAAFLLTLAGLFVYWYRSLQELFGALGPISPTPPDELGAPF